MNLARFLIFHSFCAMRAERHGWDAIVRVSTEMCEPEPFSSRSPGSGRFLGRGGSMASAGRRARQSHWERAWSKARLPRYSSRLAIGPQEDLSGLQI